VERLGHEVRVLAPHGPGLAEREVVGGVEVVRYRYGTDEQETLAYAGTMHEQALGSWGARWRLVQFLRAGRRALRRECAAFHPDVLHVHWWVPGGLAAWPGNAGRVPVVLTSHGTDLFLLDRFPVARWAAGPIFRAAAHVTVISSPLVPRVERLGVPAERITVLPMPVSAATNLVDPTCPVARTASGVEADSRAKARTTALSSERMGASSAIRSPGGFIRAAWRTRALLS